MIYLSACQRESPEKNIRNFNENGEYELDMQVYVKGPSYTAKEDDRSLRQWRLNIPKAYVSKLRMVLGRNGEPKNDPNKDKPNNYSINLSTAIDVENEKIVEQNRIDWPTDGEKRLLINLSNGKLRKRDYIKLEDKEKCLTDEEYANLFRSGRYFECSAPVCSLTMFVDGWIVRLKLDKELYEEAPQTYCDMTRSFLNKMTINRDDLFE